MKNLKVFVLLFLVLAVSACSANSEYAKAVDMVVLTAPIPDEGNVSGMTVRYFSEVGSEFFPDKYRLCVVGKGKVLSVEEFSSEEQAVERFDFYRKSVSFARNEKFYTLNVGKGKVFFNAGTVYLGLSSVFDEGENGSIALVDFIYDYDSPVVGEGVNTDVASAYFFSVDGDFYSQYTDFSKAYQALDL